MPRVQQNLITPFEEGMAVDFQEPSAEGEEAMPESASGKGFAASCGRLYGGNPSYQPLPGAGLFAHEVSVSLQHEGLPLDTYEAVQNVGGIGELRFVLNAHEEDVAYPRLGNNRREDDAVSVAFYEWSHAHA